MNLLFNRVLALRIVARELSFEGEDLLHLKRVLLQA